VPEDICFVRGCKTRRFRIVNHLPRTFEERGLIEKGLLKRKLRPLQLEAERRLAIQVSFQTTWYIKAVVQPLCKALILVHSFRDALVFPHPTSVNEMPCNVAIIPSYLYYPYYHRSSYGLEAIPLIYGVLTLECQPTTVKCSCEKKKKKKTHRKQCEACRDQSKPIQYIDYSQWHANLPI